MCKRGPGCLPRGVGGGNEEINHHPVTHVETVLHRPAERPKSLVTTEWHCLYMSHQCVLEHITDSAVPRGAFAPASLGKFTPCQIKKPHPVCTRTAGGSSSRTRCGTGLRWWRASWARPRKPRRTAAPIGPRSGSATGSCPAGWGLSITGGRPHKWDMRYKQTRAQIPVQEAGAVYELHNHALVLAWFYFFKLWVSA